MEYALGVCQRPLGICRRRFFAVPGITEFRRHGSQERRFFQELLQVARWRQHFNESNKIMVFWRDEAKEAMQCFNCLLRSLLAVINGSCPEHFSGGQTEFGVGQLRTMALRSGIMNQLAFPSYSVSQGHSGAKLPGPFLRRQNNDVKRRIQATKKPAGLLGTTISCDVRIGHYCQEVIVAVGLGILSCTGSKQVNPQRVDSRRQPAHNFRQKTGFGIHTRRCFIR